MKVAITGGTGFIGSHLARSLSTRGHDVVSISRRRISDGEPSRAQHVPGDVTDVAILTKAFQSCEAVAHCAGINREIGSQTYDAVHVQGTRNVVEAAQAAGVRKIVYISFLRARPHCGSPYHESKFASEAIVRSSGLDYTVVRPGVTYGRGDHMLDHLSHAFHTFPVFALVGVKGDRSVRPLAVQDLVFVIEAALVEGRLSRATIPVVGPEEMRLEDAVRRVAAAVGRTPRFFRLPVAVHYGLAWLGELLMKTPLVSRAQVRILSEGVTEPALPCDELPEDLRPKRRFQPEVIREGLPLPGGFGREDLRCCSKSADRVARET